LEALPIYSDIEQLVMTFFGLEMVPSKSFESAFICFIVTFECLLDLDYHYSFVRFVSVRAIDDRVFLPNYKVNPLFGDF